MGEYNAISNCANSVDWMKLKLMLKVHAFAASCWAHISPHFHTCQMSFFSLFIFNIKCEIIRFLSLSLNRWHEVNAISGNIIFGISFCKLAQPIWLHKCHTVNGNEMKRSDRKKFEICVRICNFITHYRQTRQSRQFPFASFNDWNCSIDRRQLMPNGWFYLIQFSCSPIWLQYERILKCASIFMRKISWWEGNKKWCCGLVFFCQHKWMVLNEKLYATVTLNDWWAWITFKNVRLCLVDVVVVFCFVLVKTDYLVQRGEM